MRTFFTALLNAFLPPHPRAEQAHAVTNVDWARLVAPQQLATLSWVYTLLPYYDERVRALIQAVKYYGETSLASRIAPHAAEYLMEVLAEQQNLSGWERPLVAPIPSSTKRLRERGYNQAAVFARAISKEMSGIEYDEALLSREDRPSQVHTPRAFRAKNSAGAFAASPRAAGRFVVLIDDVVESGSTLTDARRALLEAGARDVIALTIAH